MSSDQTLALPTQPVMATLIPSLTLTWHALDLALFHYLCLRKINGQQQILIARMCGSTPQPSPERLRFLPGDAHLTECDCQTLSQFTWCVSAQTRS